MLHDIGSQRSNATCHVHCKKCCRKEYHFLNVRGRVKRFLTRVLTLGLIGLVGQYRCVCCGTPRIGRFDFVRGRNPKKASYKSRSWNPLNWWFERRDSWEGLKRRKRMGKFFSRKKRYREKPFRKRNIW